MKKKKKGNPIGLSAKNSSGAHRAYTYVEYVVVVVVVVVSPLTSFSLSLSLYTQTERHSRFIHSLCLSLSLSVFVTNLRRLSRLNERTRAQRMRETQTQKSLLRLFSISVYTPLPCPLFPCDGINEAHHTGAELTLLIPPPHPPSYLAEYHFKNAGFSLFFLSCPIKY